MFLVIDFASSSFVFATATAVEGFVATYSFDFADHPWPSFGVIGKAFTVVSFVMAVAIIGIIQASFLLLGTTLEHLHRTAKNSASSVAHSG